MAVRFKRGSQAQEKKEQRKRTSDDTPLGKIFKQLRHLQFEHINNQKSIRLQLNHLSDCIINLFVELSGQLSTCAITYFIKRCKRINNIFYEISNPMYDKDFCDNYNKLIRYDNKSDERQLYLAMCRIQSKLSCQQNINVNKMVCICIFVCVKEKCQEK